MEDGTLTGESRENTAFVSITLIRAIAIAAVISENYITALPWNAVNSIPDILTTRVAEFSGTFVQVFFILSGYGLTLSYLKAPPDSWTAWARHRFLRILVPYWIAVIVTFALAKLSLLWAPAIELPDYTWTTLLAYLTFTRNFYSPGWTLNLTLWFMPAIVGLYAIFPLLLLALKRHGLIVLVAGSLLVANGSIALCVHLGYPMGHQSILPVFFVDQFAMGMALGKIAQERPEVIRRMMGIPYFFVGLGFYILSAAIVEFRLLGVGSPAYNDQFTAIGLYLMMLCIGRWIVATFPGGLLNLLQGISRRSYFMYLLHGPVICYVLKPWLGDSIQTSVHALPMLLSAGVFVMMLYLIIEGTSQLRRAA